MGWINLIRSPSCQGLAPINHVRVQFSKLLPISQKLHPKFDPIFSTFFDNYWKISRRKCTGNPTFSVAEHFKLGNPKRNTWLNYAMGARGLGSQVLKMWPENCPFCTQCSPLYILLIFRPISAIFSLYGRPNPALRGTPSQSHFALMIFGSVPKNRKSHYLQYCGYLRTAVYVYSPHGRPCRGPCHIPSWSRFAPMVFGSMPKHEYHITPNLAVIFVQ